MNNPGESVCASCGGRFSTADMVNYGNVWICAACKPGYFQRIQQGEAPSVGLVYGGFWERFAAKFIDFIILYLLQLPVNLMMGISMTGRAPQDPAQLGGYFARLGIALVLNMGLTIGFTVYLLGRYGATPGKMALKLKVVRPNGDPINYLQALGRYFAEIVSSMTCGIGYLLVAFDVERRGLHDRIASTRVIKVT